MWLVEERLIRMPVYHLDVALINVHKLKETLYIIETKRCPQIFSIYLSLCSGEKPACNWPNDNVHKVQEVATERLEKMQKLRRWKPEQSKVQSAIVRFSVIWRISFRRCTCKVAKPIKIGHKESGSKRQAFSLSLGLQAPLPQTARKSTYRAAGRQSRQANNSCWHPTSPSYAQWTAAPSPLGLR